MRTINTIEWVLRIAGLGALVLGLLFWIAQLNVINIHMLFGLIVALTLLLISLLALFTQGLRLWGIAGIVYALILPLFGLNQMFLLIGDLHWLIQLAHMLVGIGALAFAGIMAMRYRRLKQGAGKENAEGPASKGYYNANTW